MVLSLIGRVAKAYPFQFGCVFSAAKTSFSDWLVQSQIEKREHIDWRRNFTFATFGFFYLGGVQYAIYVPIFSRLFPGAAAYAALPTLSARLKDVAGTRNMLTQVILDQFVHHPLLYFPTFYCLKEVVKGNPPQAGLDLYAKNYQEDLIALWKLWVPSTIINFSIMPMHLRIPWVASTSLIWTCIISYMRGSSDVETDQDAAMDYTAGNQGKALQALCVAAAGNGTLCCPRRRPAAPSACVTSDALVRVPRPHRRYDLGVSAKPAYLYDKTKTHLLVTTSGRDRIGFMHSVSVSSPPALPPLVLALFRAHGRARQGSQRRMHARRGRRVHSARHGCRFSHICSTLSAVTTALRRNHNQSRQSTRHQGVQGRPRVCEYHAN